ncbi:MAG: hypothetical protein IPK26_07740 [Planctomycetes bacterium]|nr:hypothetical protein [Planctomycetota bacterium]
MRNLPFVLAAGLMSAAFAQQEAILPASSYFTNTGTSTLTWRTTAFRFQMVYDTTHFTNQGVTGPITISRLRFRPGSGVVNAGGSVYGTVNVQLSSCPLDYTAMSTAFATNRGGDNATCFTGSVTTLPAAGTTPNTYIIDIALTTPFVYDPTLGLDLCVEVDATAPVPNTVPTMATTNVLAQGVRRNSAATTGATTGALSTFGSELLIDFTGPGGYTSWGRSGNTVQGVGCYTTARSFYESFPGTEPVSSNDLSNKTVTMIQNGNGGYDVVTTPGATVVPPTGTGLAMLDDSESAAQLLPFTFDYPGGSTTSVVVGSNGYINLNGATNGSLVLGGTPMATTLLNGQIVTTLVGRHILAASLQDLEPDGALNVDNVFANVDPNNPNIFLITWQNVNCWHATTQPTPARSTFQIALIDGGVADTVEFRYQTLVNDSSNLSGEAATGFSLGSGSVNPGSSDLTAGVISTGVPEQAGLTMTSTAPLIGSTLTHTVSNIPGTALISARLLGFIPVPGVDLGPLAPGCKQWIDSTTAASELIFTNPTGTANLAIPYIPGLLGAVLYAQGASLVPGVNTLGLLTTNGNTLTVGNSN